MLQEMIKQNPPSDKRIQSFKLSVCLHATMRFAFGYVSYATKTNMGENAWRNNFIILKWFSSRGPGAHQGASANF